MSLGRAIATIGSLTMMSRVLGLVRDILITGLVPTPVTDAFFVAFKFPNLFRRLFAEGAFNAAFVPLFAGRLTKHGVAEARRFGGEVAAVMVAGLLAFTVIATAAMPWLMYGIAPGFADDSDKFALTIELTRLTFPYLMFMALTAMASGMLNSLEKFAAAAAAPILLNVSFIITLGLLAFDLLGAPGQSLAWAVSLAGICQFIWVAAACRRAGILPPLPRPRLTPGVRRLFQLMLPGILGQGAMQINMLVDTILASLLAEGSVTFLFIADRLNQLPLGVVGVSIGVALVPMLTRQLRSGDAASAMQTQNRALEAGLLFALPAAVGLIVLGHPIIATLFERGNFTPDKVEATANALTAFAIGLPAYIMTRALAPGFFAREDTVTPLRVSVVVVIANIALAVALMQVLQHVGIALATALTAWLNAGLLGLILFRRGHLALDSRLLGRAPRIVLAALVMGVAVWWLGQQLAGPLAGAFWQQVPALAIVVAVGAGVYFAVAQVIGAVTLADLKSVLRKPSA